MIYNTSEDSKNLIPFPHYSTHVGTKNGDSKNLIIQSSIFLSPDIKRCRMAVELIFISNICEKLHLRISKNQNVNL